MGHTPGPWKIVKILHGMSGYTYDIVAKNGPEICELTQAVSSNEVSANAQLIAGAPDLLETCKWAINEWFDRVYPPDIFVGGPSSDPGVNEVREVAERLRNAITKAESHDDA